ncbi:baseplate assembly protein [Pseudovibrio japonicus]|uniref:Baseplate assembly protein n=1 Tax=Pseudovibrio japonicus TaxID=366534 RepID=A0ABQ3ED88_9HYPH|nr:baseplate J/gp47 family protein [Pseudovibrio japonicus]GHB34079.1 baseplate assembly protein [Pseudovibrio japonicus]
MGSRFVAPDLSGLGDLPHSPIDVKEIEDRRAAFMKAALQRFGLDHNVEKTSFDPAVIIHVDGGAASEEHILQRENEAIEKTSIMTKDEDALDHIGATYYGVARQEYTDEQGNVVRESQDRYRARLPLSLEARSEHGTEGAYVYQALEMNGRESIADASALSEEDGAVYSADLHADAYTVGRRAEPFSRADNDPVIAPEVLIVVHPREGETTQELLNDVYRVCSEKGVRTNGDCLRIEPAEVKTYQIHQVIYYASGAAPEPLKKLAEESLWKYAKDRERIGLTAEILGMGGKGYVSNLESVDLISPTADVGGGQKQIPVCTDVIVEVKQLPGSWR